MIQEFTVEVGGKSLPVRFTARARFEFERIAGYPLSALRVFAGQSSDVEFAQLLAAGLEGARARGKTRRNPWTLDEVLDSVLADADGETRLAVQKTLIEAVAAAFKVSGPAAEVAAGAEGKATTA